MKKLHFIRVIAFLLIAGLAAGPLFHVVAAQPEEQTIYAGVYLDGVYVGRLTKEEAMKEYEEYIDGIDNLSLTISTSVGTYSVKLEDIDISVSVEEAVEKAFNYGRQGNILSRYKEIRALEQENVVLVPEKKFDKDILQDKLENETSDLVQEAKNASITREDGEFIVHSGQTGTEIKVEETVQALEELLAEEWNQSNIKLEAVVEEREPDYTEDDFYAIDSVMGQAVTNYNQGQSSRSQNLITGASKITGTVLMPNEQFSMYDTVSPFTEENGYSNAGQYVNNELVDGLGGGICQVSTTLYNAVLKAELQVDERYPHSLSVSYVDLSKDAAIAGDYMDFKFTNNTEYPMYIEGYAGGGSISFAVYGHDERPANRRIEFESKVIETKEPGDPEEIEDDTLEEGKTVTEQYAHTGYYAELWKNIYIDDVLQESVRVNQSLYQATKAKIRVGTKKKEEKDEKGKKKKKKTDDEEDGSDVTDDTPTEAPVTEAPAAEEPVGKPIGKRRKE